MKGASSGEEEILLSKDDNMYDSQPTRFNRCIEWCKKFFRKEHAILEEYHGVEEEGNVLLHEEYMSRISEWIKIACLLIIAIVALGVGLIYLEFLLVPLVLARFSVYLFQPFINFMVGKKALLPKLKWCRIHLPRPIAVAICFFIVFLITLLLALLIFLSLRTILEDYELYFERFQELIENLEDWLNQQGLSDEQIQGIYPSFSAGDLMPIVLSRISSLVPQAILFFMFLIYMLLEYDEKQDKEDLQRTIDKKIRNYILLKIAISAVTGFLVAVSLLILRLDMWILFGLLSFLLNFIPSVGSMIAVLVPLPVALLDPDQTWWSILLIILIPGTIQFGIGNFVEPNVMGKSMKMSAVAVLVALAFWGGVWGIIGAFMSVPLTVMLHMWLISIDHPMCQFLGHSIAGEVILSDKKKE